MAAVATQRHVGVGAVLRPDIVRLAIAECDDELAAGMLEAARTAAERMGTSTAEAAAVRCHGLTHHDLDAFVAAADAVDENPPSAASCASAPTRPPAWHLRPLVGPLIRAVI